MRHVMVSLLVLAMAAADRAHAARTLWVDHDSRGGRCNDAFTAADNAAATPAGSKPWCTLAAAGKVAEAGDTIVVRGGTYSDPMECGTAPGCSGMCVLELVKKGTAQAPIVYRAHDGETPVIEPRGAAPRIDPPFGLVYGLCAGITPPTGLCGGGARAGRECTSDDGDSTHGCPGTKCPGCCDRSPSFHTVIDGFTFRGWSFYDRDPAATNQRHRPSQYAVSLQPGTGMVTDVTLRRAELTGNDGGGAFHARATARVTLEYSHVHHNRTHGWTSAVNFWRSAGRDLGPNVARGNLIHDNQDDPPVWCLPRYCGGDTALAGACTWDAYTNKTAAAPQGYGCGCSADADCQSRRCVARDCGPATGGCECAGDTEGHGIILDVSLGTCAPAKQPAAVCGWSEDPACNHACTGTGAPYACCRGRAAGACCDDGEAGGFVVESNVIHDNEGNCVSVFKASGALVRNNTCWHNQRRPGGGEITAFANRTTIVNNVAVPRSERSCQGSVCKETYALALYAQSALFPIRPETNREGANLLWAPGATAIVQWGSGEAGTVEEFVRANGPRYGWGTHDLQTDPLFVNSAANPPDLRLREGSPALGSGDAARLAPRDVGDAPCTTADRGAYRRCPAATAVQAGHDAKP